MLAVRALDALLDYGITQSRRRNAAQWAVVRWVSASSTSPTGWRNTVSVYSDGSANSLTHKTFEAISITCWRLTSWRKSKAHARGLTKPPMRKAFCQSTPTKKDRMRLQTRRCIWTGKHCASPLRLTACATPRSLPDAV